MGADCVPHGVHVLNVVRVLPGLQRGHPDPGAPVAPAADLALVGLVDQQARPLLLRLLVRDDVPVVGDAGGAVVVGHRRQLAVGVVRQDINQLRNDVLEVRDILAVEFAVVAEVGVARVVEDARQVRDVVLARLARLDAAEVLVGAAEGAVDDGDAGLLLERVERQLAEGLRDDAAPAVEPHLQHLLRAGVLRERRLHAVGQTRGAKQAQEAAPLQVAVQVALAEAFVAFRIVHGSLLVGLAALSRSWSTCVA